MLVDYINSNRPIQTRFLAWLIEKTGARCYIKPVENLDLGSKIIIMTNQSPLFKGMAVFIVGLLAYYFAGYMKKKGEPESISFKIFYWLSVFIIFYGMYILIVRPGWWKLPY